MNLVDSDRFAEECDSSDCRKLGCVASFCDGDRVAREVQAMRRDLKLTPAVTRDKEIKIFFLKHASPDELAQIVNGLFGKEDVGATVDKRTKSLIVYAPKDRLATIESLAQALDVEQAKPSR